jgi:hypothetical protein
MTNATSTNSKKPKCLPQAQHRHFGCFATRCGQWQLETGDMIKGEMKERFAGGGIAARPGRSDK